MAYADKIAPGGRRPRPAAAIPNLATPPAPAPGGPFRGTPAPSFTNLEGQALDAAGDYAKSSQPAREYVRNQQVHTKLAQPWEIDPGLKSNVYGLLSTPIADRTAAPVTVGDFGAGQANALGLQARGAQSTALGLQGQAAAGLAPSVAQIQMQQGLDQATAAQMALANSARGGAGAQALALRNAQNVGAGIQQAGVAQSAALRAGEMAAARDAFANTAGAQRAGDLGLLGSSRNFALGEAGLQQGLSLANLGAGMTTDQMNLDRQTQGLGLLTGAEQLGMDAYYRPIEDQIDIMLGRMGSKQQKPNYAGQILGGLMNAGGAIGGAYAGRA